MYCNTKAHPLTRFCLQKNGKYSKGCNDEHDNGDDPEEQGDTSEEEGSDGATEFKVEVKQLSNGKAETDVDRPSDTLKHHRRSAKGFFNTGLPGDSPALQCFSCFTARTRFSPADLDALYH